MYNIYMNSTILTEQKLFKQINLLPDELIQMIKEYIPLYTYIFTNRTNYFHYHYLLKKEIMKKSLHDMIRIENYVRTMIRRDFDFVFEQIIKENYIYWLNHKKYIYKNSKYANYIYFLIDYCIENDSDKCKIVLVNFLKEHDLCQNKHKKNTNIHIRWRT